MRPARPPRWPASAHPPAAPAPVHAEPVPAAHKGGGELVSLAVGGLVSAAGVRAMSQVLIAIVQRPGRRRVEIRLGDDSLILDSASARESRAALEGFLERVGPADES